MGKKANVLVVEVGPEDYDDVAPPLLRSLFDIDRVPGAESALDLVTNPGVGNRCNDTGQGRESQSRFVVLEIGGEPP